MRRYLGCLFLWCALLACSVRSEGSKEAPPTPPSTPPATQSATQPSSRPVVLSVVSLPAVIEPPSNEVQILITLVSDKLIVQHHETMSELPNTGGRYDLNGLAAILTAIKKEHPREDSITLKAEKSAAHSAVVQVLDTLRSAGFSKMQLTTL